MENVSFMKSTIKRNISNYSLNTLESLLLSNYKNMAKADGKNLEKLIENKFYCAKKFTEAIEILAHEKEGMSYVDAIVHFCEQNNIDVESVPKLITKPLKEKLKGEAMELNLLKRTSRAKLPL